MQNITLGLGDVVVPATSTPSPSVWDKINTVITKVAQPAANVYTQIKTNQAANQSGAVTPSPSVFPTSVTQPAPEVQPVDNTKKYLMIGGAVLVAGVLIYVVTKKKGKK
jgi:hypothetical protein